MDSRFRGNDVKIGTSDIPMKTLDDLQPQNPQQGFQFPGAFEITAMGNATAGLEQRVPEIIAGLGLNVIDGSLRARASREGHYVSVSVTFTCPSREKYDAAHAALRADPDIRWTL
jgi:putative lipoic acid-binding regulatory protein